MQVTLKRLATDWARLALALTQPMRPALRPALARTHRERGSVLILVIAILAVLILLSVSMSYTTRVELLASRNWSNSVQAKLAAVTGVPLFNPGNSNAGMSAPRDAIAAARQSATVTSGSTPLESAAQARDLKPFQLGLRPEALLQAASGSTAAVQGAGDSTAAAAATRSATANFAGRQTSGDTTRQRQMGVLASSASGNATTINDPAGSTAAGVSDGTLRADTAAALAQFSLLDTSAQININAVIPTSAVQTSRVRTKSFGSSASAEDFAPPAPTEKMLAQLIANVFVQKGISQPEPVKLARAIALRRYGADQAPGTSGQDDEREAYDAWQLAAQLEANSSSKDAVRSSRDLPPVIDPATDGLDNDRDGEIDNAGEDFEHDGIDNNFDGEMDESGESVDNPGESRSDPAQPAYGDDRPWASLTELMDLPGMHAAAYNALVPYLTVHAASFAAWELPHDSSTQAGERMGFVQLDPNTAPPELIYELLRRRFPEASQDMLAQFAANMVDRRDEDPTPTELNLSGKRYWGIERTPLINEVCADTASFDEEGDDGQYIELYNPYDESVSLTGWSIQGAGPSIILNGTLPPDGYLVLTNDFKNDNDRSPEPEGSGMGSFYDLFGMVPTGGTRQLEEYPQLDLPNAGGQIRLQNNKGQVVDVFEYGDARWNGAPLSFQRQDPRLRFSEKATATPMAANANFRLDSTAREALRIATEWHDQPYRSALDVMLVSAAWVETSTHLVPTAPGAEPRVTIKETPHAWALPVLRSNGISALDVRLVDCFRVGVVLPPASKSDALERTGIDARDITATSTGNRADLRDLQERRDAVESGAPRCAVQYGLININSASILVLAQLPGMDGTLVGALQDARWRDWMDPQTEPLDHSREIQANDQLFDYWMARNPLDPPRWRNLSDFLLDDYVWGSRPLYDRLDAAYPFFGLLTTHAQTMRVDTANTIASAPGASESMPSRAMASRLISGLRGPAETVAFSYVGLGSAELGDSDLRYGVAAGRAHAVFDNEQLISEARRQQAGAADPAEGSESTGAAASRGFAGLSSSGSGQKRAALAVSQSGNDTP